MKDFIDTIKNYFSFIWRKPKTTDDRILKRYDLLLFIGGTFLIIYTAFFFLNIQQSTYNESPSVVDVGMNVGTELHPLLTASPNIGYSVATTPATMILKTNQFYVGEIVGIRYFGIFGIVRDKILSTGGYKYNVRWRDTSHQLPTDEFHSWELYRPERGAIPASVLLP